MILLIECLIDSDTIIHEIIELKRKSYLLKLHPDKHKRLNKVTIECKFDNYKKYTPKVTIIGGKITGIEFPEHNFFPEQLSMLQYIESFSALDLGVRRIFWEAPKIIWIPESEEERIAITRYDRKEEYHRENRAVSKNWLENTLIHQGMLNHLTEPLSFYRIGVNHFFEKSYIQAFLYFYMMLEGCFGNGNTKKKQSIDAFMNAQFLIYGIENSLATAKDKNDIHKNWFDNYSFTNEEVNEDPIRKMINILVEERGKLAHYLGGEVVRRRNNFEEKKYQSLAWLSMSICNFASIKLRFDPFRKK